MRILGLDMGDKNIGVAISDPSGCIAYALEVIPRKEKKDMLRITKLIEEYDVHLIVVGLPFKMNATISEQGRKVLSFVEELKEKVEVPVVTWDERLSTVAAERLLLDADLSRARRKKIIDKIAAAIILQNYLDACKNS